MDETARMLTVVTHPLVQIRLTRLRDKSTGHEEFRRCVHEITRLMAHEITAGLELTTVAVTTPMGHAQGSELARPVVLAPILRAGLGMLHGMLEVMPEARVGHIGMFRNEDTLRPETYYCKTPEDLSGAEVILLDPMLATGNSASAAAAQLRAMGARRLTFACIISAPQGVENFSRQHPDVPVFTAAVDHGLTEIGYITPGLGDAGDRYFGTVQPSS